MINSIQYRSWRYGCTTPLTLPDSFYSDISTLAGFPANISFSAGVILPPNFLEGDWKLVDKTVAAQVASFAAVIGSAAGGALLMNFIEPGGISAGFGLLAGGGLSFISVRKIAELDLGGAGVRFNVKLDTVAKSAEEAKKLAQLATETAFLIGNRHSAIVGPQPSRNDGVRKVVAERLLELGFDKKDASGMAQFDDPHMAIRIIRSMLIHAAEKVPGHEVASRDELKMKLLGPNAPREPKEIEAILGEDLLKDEGVRAAMNFYRNWHANDAKLYFVVENLDKLQSVEKEARDQRKHQ